MIYLIPRGILAGRGAADRRPAPSVVQGFLVLVTGPAC